MNEVYARDISKKVQSALAAKRKRGEFCGSLAPYGYAKSGKSFMIDEEAAAVVRQIFGWVLDGVSDMGIAQRLNAQNSLPPSRYRFQKGVCKAKRFEESLFWYKSTVKRITENPVYTGVMAGGKLQSNFLRGGGQIVKSVEDWVIVGDTHPAIVSNEIFMSVRAIREVRGQKARSQSAGVGTANVFRGLIFCGDCKKHMTRHKNVYSCNIYHEVDKQACTAKTIREADLKAAVFAYISREIALAVDMHGMVAELQRRTDHPRRNDSMDKRIGALQSKLTQNRRFRGSLREDYRDGLLSEQDYMTMKADYDEERDSLSRELDALKSEKARQEKTLSPDNKWIAALRSFETEQELSAEMVSALVERIEVYDGARLEITLKHRDELQALLEYVGSHEREARAVNE
jgi:hypothetical protein